MFGKKKTSIEKDPEAYMRQMHEHVVKVCKSTFDKAGWQYTFKPDEDVILSGFMGDDLPINFALIIRDISMHFVCRLAFEAEPDKFKEVCWALNDINKTLIFGAFYLDSEDGEITFEWGMPFLETDFSEETIGSLIKMIVETVDKHDGDLEKIAKKVSPKSDVANPMFG